MTSSLLQLKDLGFQLSDLDGFSFRRLTSNCLLIEARGTFQETQTNLCECRSIPNTPLPVRYPSPRHGFSLSLETLVVKSHIVVRIWCLPNSTVLAEERAYGHRMSPCRSALTTKHRNQYWWIASGFQRSVELSCPECREIRKTEQTVRSTLYS